jgi:hypothetical protein
MFRKLMAFYLPMIINLLLALNESNTKILRARNFVGLICFDLFAPLTWAR